MEAPDTGKKLKRKEGLSPKLSEKGATASVMVAGEKNAIAITKKNKEEKEAMAYHRTKKMERKLILY